MPAPRKHKEPIVEAAIRHFREQGYPETRLNEIAESCGAPKSSMYYHFPDGKRSIAVAVIEEGAKSTAQTMREIAAATDSPEAFIRGLAAKLAEWMAESSYRNGCSMTSVFLELAPDDRDVCRAGKRAYAERFAVISEVLVEAGYTESSAQEIALLWVSSLKGALIQCRVDRSPRPLLRLGETLADVLAVFPRNPELKQAL